MATEPISDIGFEAGFIVIKTGKGNIPKRIAIADILRAADIPALTFAQVAAVTTLAGLMAILIRTLIDRDILDDSFGDSLGLDVGIDSIIYSLEQIGGGEAYAEPNIYVPNV